MTVYLERALQDVYAAHQQLTPALVVQAAAPVGSALHHRFEWDNKVAGPLWRLQQASALIRSVKIIRQDNPDVAPIRVRAFLHVPAAPGEEESDAGASYVPTRIVAASPAMNQIVRREMQRRIAELRRTYGAYSEFWDEMRALVSDAA